MLKRMIVVHEKGEYRWWRDDAMDIGCLRACDEEVRSSLMLDQQECTENLRRHGRTGDGVAVSYEMGHSVTPNFSNSILGSRQ